MSSHNQVVIHDELGPIDWTHPASITDMVIDRRTALRSTEHPQERRKKVAIVGFASGTMGLAPFHDPEYEIWGMNQLYRRIPRADRWFEIHHNFDEFVVEGTDHIGWLKECPIPIYMVDAFPEFPTAVRFPIEQFIHPGPKCIDYFTSSIAYMLAIALEEGFEQIGLYGIDLASGPNMSTNGLALNSVGSPDERGVKLEIPQDSALLKQIYRYGYQLPDQEPKIHMRELVERQAGFEKEKQELLKHLYMRDGALQELGFLIQVYDLRLKGCSQSVFKAPASDATMSAKTVEDKIKHYDQLAKENLHLKQALQRMETVVGKTMDNPLDKPMSDNGEVGTIPRNPLEVGADGDGRSNDQESWPHADARGG